MLRMFQEITHGQTLVGEYQLLRLPIPAFGRTNNGTIGRKKPVFVYFAARVDAALRSKLTNPALPHSASLCHFFGRENVQLGPPPVFTLCRKPISAALSHAIKVRSGITNEPGVPVREI
jgi:hypothetical protein